jgi:hypothetical protein
MNRTPIHVTLVLAATVAALTGCSRIPTAPSPETSAAVAPASAPVVLGQVDDPHAPGELGTSGLDTITLDVGQSGAVRAGRFTLFFHKNSLKMPATITMSQPDPNVMQVEFTITPAAANDFQVPVKLVADCSGQPQATIDTDTAYWWDGMWVEADRKTVSQVGNTIVAQCQTLTTAKIDLKAGKNTMAN